jgi:hypothetical protein
VGQKNDGGGGPKKLNTSNNRSLYQIQAMGSTSCCCIKYKHQARGQKDDGGGGTKKVEYKQ